MQEIPQKTTGKIREKLFKRSAKPHGQSVLVFRIIDMLSATDEHLTILQIQKKIQAQSRCFYSHHAIMYTINNLHLYCDTLALDSKRLPAKRNKAFAFKISINK